MSDYAPELLPPLTPAPRARLWPPLFPVAAGILLLAAAGIVESGRVERQPWSRALFAPQGETTAEGAFAAWSRRVPRENFWSFADWLEAHDPESGKSPEAASLLNKLRENEAETELVVALPLPVTELQPLLASGRLPEPGKPEVLAGPLAREDSFEMDGMRFESVGRIDPRAAPFLFSYVLPEDPTLSPHFNAESGALRGWIHPEGLDNLDSLLGNPKTPDADSTTTAETPSAPAESTTSIDRKTPPEPAVIGGLGVAGVDLTLIGILGLALVCAGGTWTATRFWERFRHTDLGASLPLLAEIARRKRLWIGLHVLNYGLLLGLMLVAVRYPLINMSLSTFMAQMFTEGELSYIGSAYAAGNIWDAALATFFNNYISATLVMTLGISLILPGIGVVKTAGSLLLMGFVMAPLWTGLLSGYSYHSVTIVLEIEAYTLAAFATATYAIAFVRGLAQGALAEHWSRGMRFMIDAALLSGLQLALAAAYEAATLILFHS